MDYIKYRRFSTADIGRSGRRCRSRPVRRVEGERSVLNTTIMLFLLQDGITNGAIYALLGLALVLVFAVTRVILIPQGEFVTYGALSYAMLATGQVPGTAKLAVAMGVAAFALDLFVARKSLRLQRVARAAALNILFPVAILRADLFARRPENAGRGQHRAGAADRRGDRTVSLSHRLPADRAHFRAGAPDRFRRLPPRAAGPRAGVLRRRRLARARAVERRAHRRTAALHRPEHRGLWPDRRLHRRAVAVLRLHADRQGAARHRRQSPRRAACRHPDHAVGPDRLPAGFA